MRAVAYLPDGNSTEDLVFVNAPDTLEEIQVDLVELYTTAVDRRGRPVPDLQARDFTIKEDGVRQEIARFERVTDLPIHVGITLDTSASMEKSLPQARDAALGFLRRTIRPKDRAAVVGGITRRWAGEGGQVAWERRQAKHFHAPLRMRVAPQGRLE